VQELKVKRQIVLEKVIKVTNKQILMLKLIFTDQSGKNDNEDL